MTCIEERLQRADPVVLAYDIETTKSPLKFPDPATDQIMMISYMIDGQGFLITNRSIVSEDIADFEYTPKPEYEGPFLVFNEPGEKAVIERFFQHIKEAKPTVIATYNGDFFDWPFVETRASVQGIDMYQEIGFRKNSEDIYYSDYSAHMDCFAWVNRDSYLPQGSRGLKAVTTAKLGYDPDELDPELMTPYAKDRPQILAEYSVSDAVATYYLYMKYVHPFIFSLCTIVPLNPDDVLRKGTGTLCEMLLMVQAYQKEIVLPNKHKEPKESFWEGHLLESETYVGGHVESIEAGVFRSDIPVNFSVEPTAIEELQRDLDAALRFSIEVEEKKNLEDITNYAAVRDEIFAKLDELKQTPNRNEKPSIYHLDVASMYPNIMTTNRLQPDSMVQESDCAACDFNRPGKTCDRRLPWSWRGEFLPAQKNEYNMVRHALENERFPNKHPALPLRAFQELSWDEQATMVKKRLSDYSKKIYHKIHETQTVEREAIICQRENPFYVDTVKNFRDRRYDFKGKQKIWKGKTEVLRSSGATAAEVEDAKKMVVLFDSLQLAHKVILNSFYGYVMRKGSRWYSMEMAGVTCLTGAHIIQMARELVERIGRPLELDTDGIWCMLPATFPENVVFTLRNGKKLPVSYPCVMLNHLVHARFTNHQYQELVDRKHFRYETHSDNSIFFEVDGPYKAMILPTSKEEDKNLKKRYAVFNHDGTLAELKGFEVKRRGELKLIKIFQTQIFRFFLEGSSLVEVYAAVAQVANRWLDVLHQHGATLADDELIELICENRSMTKALVEYGTQKSTSITTAKRLAEFLGAQMVKDKGLNCKYVIAAKPRGAPVTERAIPVAIFSADDGVKRYFLRKWLKEEPSDTNPRNLIDWGYYLERLSSVIQKLVTIPAALQKVRNPIPRVGHPDWLQKRINSKDDRFKQKKMTDLMTKSPLSEISLNTTDRRLHRELRAAGVAGTQAAYPPAKQQKRKGQNAPQIATDPYSALPPRMPSPLHDYVGFLQYQKKKWRIQKQARSRRRHLFGDHSLAGSENLGNLFRTQAEAAFARPWQIICMRESDNPGIVEAFVLLDKIIHILKIRVPRQLFLNLKSQQLPDVDIEGCSVEKVNHTLPNGHPSTHLFKLVMSEETYVNERQQIEALSNHPSVEGVYEKEVGSAIRAVLNLGNQCSIDESQKGALGRGLDNGFELSALQRNPDLQGYLLDVSLGFIFLYHVATGERNIFALFSTGSEDADVFILDRSRDNQSFHNPDKLYHDMLARWRQDHSQGTSALPFNYQDQLNIRIHHKITKRKTYQELANLITKAKNLDNRPTIIAIQSSQRHLLVHELPILRKYPVLHIKSDTQDNALPHLGWQTYILRRLLSHYLSLSSWISHLLELAKYGDIPLCNLETEDARFLIDVAYARRLHSNNVVLWWTRQPLPDHAGYQKDGLLQSMENVQMPSINTPGTYSSVCIEINIRNLAINTLLTSSLITELEGVEAITANPAELEEDNADGEIGTMTADNAFASAGVRVLREMVKAWWLEASRGNGMADVMVQQLLRWIETPGSYLYDHALYYYMQMMSKKALQQLMADFRRVGSHVVYADADTLMLQTTKVEVANAYAYSQYVVKSIKSKPLFHFLDLTIKEYWDYLIWYDKFNFGGKACQEIVEVETQPLNTIMHWQLNSFLPKPYQPIFHDWIVEFIEAMHQQKHPEQGTDEGPPRSTQIPIRSPVEDKETTSSTIIHKSAALGTISTPLKRQIQSLISRYRAEMVNPTLATDHSFPLLPGSHLDFKNTHPVLQLIRSIMHVFLLDRGITNEVRLLRKDLLALFEIKEFSASAKFQNPSESLLLQQIICAQCMISRDLDLCRTGDILPPNSISESDGVIQARPWRCTDCGHEYDRLALEERLIAQVQLLLSQWQMQDLACSKCKRLRLNDFMEHCGCGGEWKETMRRDEVQRKIKMMERVVEGYGLKMLGEVVVTALARI